MTGCSRLAERHPSADRGAVTAELAVALPALVVATVLLMWLVGVAAAHVRCADAVREAARALARGDGPLGDAARRGDHAAPAGWAMTSRTYDGLVQVTVRATVRPPGSLGHLVPSSTVIASASALLEPDVVGAVVPTVGGDG